MTDVNRALYLGAAVTLGLLAAAGVVQYASSESNRERPFKPMCGDWERLNWRVFTASGWRPLDGHLAPLFAIGWGEPGEEVVTIGLEADADAIGPARAKAVLVVGKDGTLIVPKDAYRGSKDARVDEALGNFTNKVVAAYVKDNAVDVRERLARWRKAVAGNAKALNGLDGVESYLKGERTKVECWQVRVVAIEAESSTDLD